MHMKWKRGAPNTKPTTRNQIGRKRRGTNRTKDDNNKVQHNNQSIAGHGIRIVDEISQLIESWKGRERKPQSIPAWIGRIAPSIKRDSRRDENETRMPQSTDRRKQPKEAKGITAAWKHGENEGQTAAARKQRTKARREDVLCELLCCMIRMHTITINLHESLRSFQTHPILLYRKYPINMEARRRICRSQILVVWVSDCHK